MHFYPTKNQLLKNKSDCIEEFFSDGRSKITLFCVNREKGDYEECFAISYLKRTLTIFHIKNDVEKHAVKYYNFDKSTNPK